MSATQLLKHLKEPGIGPGKLLTRVAWACALLSVVAAAAIENQPQAQRGPSEQAAQSSQNTDADQLRKTVQQLSAELTRLKKRVAELEKDRTVDALQDKLGKEQQRAEVLNGQLLVTMEKEGTLQARVEQLDEQLRPENIDNSQVGVGSLHPEDAREALRRRLTNEKRRAQTQLDLLRQDHARLQASLADADLSIQRLRLRLAEAVRS
jgi:small-conductance mechanosensitive channel